MPSLVRPDPPSSLEEARAQLDAVWDALETLHEQNEELREQVRELLERGGKSSRNSSKPPSSDSPAQRAKRPSRRRSPRRKGAQVGHPRHERAVLPESEVDEVQRYFPAAACSCGSPIAIEAQPTCRHQVFDLPEVTHTVVEHQLFGGRCGGCGQSHVAEAPDTVPSGQMGPGLVAWIALMAGEHHLSVRQIRRLLAEQWNLSFSVGAISELCRARHSSLYADPRVMPRRWPAMARAVRSVSSNAA